MDVISKPFQKLAHWVVHRTLNSIQEFDEEGLDYPSLLGVNGVFLSEMTRY